MCFSDVCKYIALSLKFFPQKFQLTTVFLLSMWDVDCKLQLTHSSMSHMNVSLKVKEFCGILDPRMPTFCNSEFR